MIQKITSLSCHSNSTNCIKIGQKSSRIMVSGGDDCKVNLWALGKPNCLLSLSGHNAPIDSVCLDWPEELVVAGSSTGSIKLWDLEQAKGIFIRTLLGHSKSVSALEFHPFGEFFASGSNDEVKLWDVRRKGCIQTYHGHHQPITHLKITPDGRWVCSGSKDGVKLWDMTLGKLVHSFEIQNVKSIAFNPSEFVVSLSGEETSVFDLSTFELISKTKESGQLVFNNDGSRLVVCGDRKAHYFQWEPMESKNTIDHQFGDIKDLVFLQESDKMVVGSVNGHIVNVYGVKWQTVLPPIVQEEMPVQEMEPKPPLPQKKAFEYIPSFDGQTVLNLDLAKFLQSGSKSVSLKQNLKPDSEPELIDSLCFRHDSISNILTRKLTHLQEIRDQWDESNIKNAIVQLSQSRDPSVCVDICRIIKLKPRLLTLESAGLLMPMLSELLFDIYQEHMTIACEMVRVILKSFWPVIESTLQLTPDNDILESRIQKCTLLKQELDQFGQILSEIHTNGKLGKLIQETMQDLAQTA